MGHVSINMSYDTHMFHLWCKVNNTAINRNLISELGKFNKMLFVWWRISQELSLAWNKFNSVLLTIFLS